MSQSRLRLFTVKSGRCQSNRLAPKRRHLCSRSSSHCGNNRRRRTGLAVARRGGTGRAVSMRRHPIFRREMRKTETDDRTSPIPLETGAAADGHQLVSLTSCLATPCKMTVCNQSAGDHRQADFKTIFGNHFFSIHGLFRCTEVPRQSIAEEKTQRSGHSRLVRPQLTGGLAHFAMSPIGVGGWDGS
jgi:hypothetical protein